MVKTKTPKPNLQERLAKMCTNRHTLYLLFIICQFVNEKNFVTMLWCYEIYWAVKCLILMVYSFNNLM